MSDFLEQVIAERRVDVARAKVQVAEEVLLARARGPVLGRVREYGRGNARGWGDPFTSALRTLHGRLGVIAEVKRRSPALGILNADADPAMLALAYEAAGATAVSVLTEPRHWGGSFEDLVAVSQAVRIPVLCKDVIVDEYQIAQARAAGADAVLLIAEALSDEELRRFIARATTLGMGVLLEAHEPVAFGRAVAAGTLVVGVNARNLRRPSEIDVGRARQLHTFARDAQILVAESGIASVDDARLLPARVDAVLVGSALMQSDDPMPLIKGIAAIHRGATRTITVRP
ncbi:MAG TPA: indole-3-glycerol phosphate synthase TrpC [Candidatus Limnocylindria bacterium]|jgi:indole-3-glycerol phosphate synthase|nr:indole-3-glycerol phosphate synthase TrpC [Candidatus Limnocylindria bacterium]